MQLQDTTSPIPGIPPEILFYALLGLGGVVLMFVFVLIVNIILMRASHNDLVSRPPQNDVSRDKSEHHSAVGRDTKTT